MYPKIFEMVKNDPGVIALLGSNPLRFFPFGSAPQDTNATYAVWQTISGNPANILKGRPKTDEWSVQVDVYGKTAESVRKTANAIIYAIEEQTYITSIRGEDRDPETKFYRYSFDVQIFQSRS